MKNGKKPNVRQMKLLAANRLDPKDWLVVKDTPEQMELVHRFSDKTRRVIQKGGT